MPVFRYFLVMGCCLLGLLFVADWMWPGDAGSGAYHPTTVAAADLAAATAVLSSIDDWRRSEGRFERSKQHPQPIVYPDLATLAPTTDRLQWERHLRYLPENHVYEARAEMPRETTVEPPKVAGKITPPRKHVAHARNSARIVANVERPHPRYARNSTWDPFGLFD
jgi:hypothetical protein